MKEDLKTLQPLIFLAYILPVIFIAIGIPLALNMIEPNGMYGVRTAKTLSDPSVWYSANKFGGISFIISGVAALFVIAKVQRSTTMGVLAKFVVAFSVPIIFVLIASFVTLISIP